MINRKDFIVESLLNYWRWIAEGKPEKQYYYDDYHDHIKYLGDNLYQYRIQISDSPEGDTWIKGEFRIKEGNDIEIINEFEEYV